MSNETPRSGTIQAAQAEVLSMLNGEEVVDTPEPLDSAPPEELPIEEEQEDLGYTDDDEADIRTFNVRVDGDDLEVTEEELLKGYSRQSDYSKKTQELAEQRQGLEAMTQENAAARERMSQLIPELEANLLKIQQGLDAEPNWDALYKQDPTKAIRIERDFNRRKEANKQQLAALAQEKQRLHVEQESHTAQARDQFLNQQANLLIENIPEWKDDKRALSEKAAIEEWSLKNGYLSKDRIANIMDWGSVAMMRKAWLYDQGKVAVKKAQAKSSQTLSPGNKTRSAPTRSAYRDQQARLRKTGNTKDAEALIAMQLNSIKR